MIPSLRTCVLLLGLLGLVAVWASGRAGGIPDPPDVVPIGLFSEMDPSRELPVEWRSLSLAAAYKETTYDLVRLDGTVAVRARSASGTSAIGIKRQVDLTTHPILEWRWKIGGVIEDANVYKRQRFDAPVRVVVEFAYDDFGLISRLKIVAFRALGFDLFPRRSIMYVWTTRMGQYEVAPTPHARWIRMVSVRRGATGVGTWQTERRNVRKDYRRIFGEEPPPVSGIAFMTDTNSVGDTLTSYYGDILFRAEGTDVAVDTTLSRREASEEGGP